MPKVRHSTVRTERTVHRHTSPGVVVVVETRHEVFGLTLRSTVDVDRYEGLLTWTVRPDRGRSQVRIGRHTRVFLCTCVQERISLHTGDGSRTVSVEFT